MAATTLEEILDPETGYSETGIERVLENGLAQLEGQTTTIHYAAASDVINFLKGKNSRVLDGLPRERVALVEGFIKANRARIEAATRAVSAPEL